VLSGWTRSHTTVSPQISSGSARELSVVQIEASPRLSRGTRVNSQNKRLFAANESSSRGLALYSEYRSAHVGLESCHAQRNRNGSDAVHAEVGNRNKSTGAGRGSGRTVTGPRHGGGWGGAQDSEGVRRGGGGLFPLNCTVASLGSDAVHVVHPSEELAVAVAQHTSRHSSEVLGAVSGSFPRCCAGDLPGKNVVGLGCCISTATPCEGHGDSVGGSCPKFSVHVIACVSSTDRRRIHPSLSSHGQGVIARPGSGGGDKPGECLEIQPQLADIVRDLADAEGTTSCTARRVAAGVARVPDVGGVGGDGGATGSGVDHTADSEPSSTVAVSTSALSRAFRAG